MRLMKAQKLIFGGFVAIAMLGIPACSTTSKESPSAFTGDSQKETRMHTHGAPGKSNYRRHAH